MPTAHYPQLVERYIWQQIDLSTNHIVAENLLHLRISHQYVSEWVRKCRIADVYFRQVGATQGHQPPEKRTEWTAFPCSLKYWETISCVLMLKLNWTSDADIFLCTTQCNTAAFDISTHQWKVNCLDWREWILISERVRNVLEFLSHSCCRLRQ